MIDRERTDNNHLGGGGGGGVFLCLPRYNSNYLRTSNSQVSTVYGLFVEHMY